MRISVVLQNCILVLVVLEVGTVAPCKGLGETSSDPYLVADPVVLICC